ncbi:hypothetical protein [Corynebacterium argentoratense]|nr:hypothetical protein [Corynebacterium argentoratense]
MVHTLAQENHTQTGDTSTTTAATADQPSIDATAPVGTIGPGVLHTG